ncbi:hypothetical protein V8E52_009339 [Russula decolorans]
MPPDAFLDRFLPSHSISIPEGTPNFQAGMFTSLLPPTGATSVTDAADATGATGLSGATKPTPYKAIDSLGHISLTADVWSSGNFSSYLALTCHWISDKGPNGSLLLKSALIGFHRLKNKHTGKNIARNILHLLKHAGITSKGKNTLPTIDI